MNDFEFQRSAESNKMLNFPKDVKFHKYLKNISADTI